MSIKNWASFICICVPPMPTENKLIFGPSDLALKEIGQSAVPGTPSRSEVNVYWMSQIHELKRTRGGITLKPVRKPQRVRGSPEQEENSLTPLGHDEHRDMAAGSRMRKREMSFLKSNPWNIPSVILLICPYNSQPTSPGNCGERQRIEGCTSFGAPHPLPN